MAKRKDDRGGGEVPEFLEPFTGGMEEMRALAGGEELPFGVNVVRASLLAGKKAGTPQEASRLAVLHYAVDYGRVELLRKFLADGVDPNMKLFDETLLGLAAGKHHTAIVRELLKAGADPNRKSEGYPPILHAAGDPEQVKVMLEAGADPNAVGQDGSSVLVGAALAGSTEVVKLLLAHGADVNGSSSLYVSSRKPTKGITALMAAAWMGHEKVVRQLIEAGTDPKRADEKGHTAVDWARLCREKKKAAKVIEFLEAAGAAEGEPFIEIAGVPDFEARAKRPEFKAAVAEFTRQLGKPARGFGEFDGGAFFKMTKKKAEAIVEQEQEKWLAQSVFVFRTGYNTPDDESYVGLLPTADKYDALAALETGGMNEGGTADVIRRLKQIEKDDPFVLTFISEDTVEGEFNEKVKTPARVAKKIYAICSDIVTQGTGTVAALAKELQRSRRLFLWWD